MKGREGKETKRKGNERERKEREGEEREERREGKGKEGKGREERREGWDGIGYYDLPNVNYTLHLPTGQLIQLVSRI